MAYILEKSNQTILVRLNLSIDNIEQRHNVTSAYLAWGHVRNAPVCLYGLKLVETPVQLLQRLQGYPYKVLV